VNRAIVAAFPIRANHQSDSSRLMLDEATLEV